MHPGRIADSNVALGAPKGWDPEKHGPCSVLHARAATDEAGIPSITSAWFPTPAELARIAAGAPVYVTLVTAPDGHPPICIGVGPAPADGAA